MMKSNILAVVAVLGLAACATPPGQETFALLDNTGRVVAMVPASVVGNTPVGTALRANIGGQDQLVTLGPRQGGASAGMTRVVGSDDGRPVVERISPATGDFAPAGTPVVTGSDQGRPVTTFVQPGQRAPTGVVAGPRGNRRATPTAPGTLAPGVAPVVQPNR